MTRSNANNESSVLVDILFPSLKAVGLALGVMLVLAALFSGISLAFGDPDGVAAILAYVTLALSALLCGVFGMISDKERRIVVPLISGALYVLVLIILSLFVHTDEAGMPILLRALVYAACVILSFLGGILAGRRRNASGRSTKNPAALMRKRISGKK